MHSPDEMVQFAGLLPRLALPAALVLVVGCASMPGGEPADELARTEPASREEAQTTQADSDAVIERRRRDYPQLEADDTGFTITERIRISGDVRSDYQNALQLLQAEQYERGIALLRAVTERAPEVTAPHIDLAIAYRRSGDLEGAEAALRVAAQLSPDHPIVYNELGILYRKTGRFPAARSSYEKALAVYPGFHFARRNLAVLCDLYLADLRCALENYEVYMQSVLEDEEVEIWIADIRNRLDQ